jgi:hypothetical protein
MVVDMMMMMGWLIVIVVVVVFGEGGKCGRREEVDVEGRCLWGGWRVWGMCRVR